MPSIWFVVRLTANDVSDTEPLLFDPVDVWTATLIVTPAFDPGASHARPRRDAAPRVLERGHGPT